MRYAIINKASGIVENVTEGDKERFVAEIGKAGEHIMGERDWAANFNATSATHQAIPAEVDTGIGDTYDGKLFDRRVIPRSEKVAEVQARIEARERGSGVSRAVRESLIELKVATMTGTEKALYASDPNYKALKDLDDEFKTMRAEIAAIPKGAM